MKKTTFLPSIAALLLLVITLTGCPVTEVVEKVSVADRMAMFKTDVDAKTWGNLQGHTYTLAAGYSQANAAYWSTLFPLDGPFTYTVSGDTATATKDLINYTFSLKTEAKDVYKIYKIVNTTTGVTVFQ